MEIYSTHRLNKIADMWLSEKKSIPTFRTFTHEKELHKIGLQNQSNKILSLNKLRNRLYHFNWVKFETAIIELN